METFLAVGESDGYLLGYVDGSPMAKKIGCDPEPVSDMDDFNGWCVQQFGLERLWIDERGEVRDWR